MKPSRIELVDPELADVPGGTRRLRRSSTDGAA